MFLTNEQYDQIMRVYEERQMERRREIERRKRKLDARVPGIEEINARIRRMAIEEVRRRLQPVDEVNGQQGGSSEGADFDGKGEEKESAGIHNASEQTGGSVAESPHLGKNRKAISDSEITLEEQIRALSVEKTALMEEAGVEADYLDVPYTCPDCQDTGFVDGEHCHCFDQLCLEMLHDSHTDFISQLRLDDFSLDYYPASFLDTLTGKSSRDLAEAAVRQARIFVSEFDASFQNILLIGKTGTGKTHLSGCIGGEVLSSGHSVDYLTAYELFSVMKREAFSRDWREGADFSKMFSCDLLIIDDLGTEFANSMTNSQFFELINARIRRKRSTLISTNLDLKELGAIYTERIVSRFVENYTTLSLVGPDIRMLKKVPDLSPPDDAGESHSDGAK